MFISLSLLTPIYIKDSFPLACPTKLALITQPCGPKQIFIWPYFPSTWFLKFYWCSFCSQPLNTNIHIGFFFLVLLDQTGSNHLALWTQTNFDLIHFQSAWFLKFYLHLFRSASEYQHTYRIGFPWPLTNLTLITQPCGHNQILTWVHFPSAWFLRFFYFCFAHPLTNNIH